MCIRDREKVIPRWAELETLLSHTTRFDADAISERIATRKWSKAFRADELLQLTSRQQYQLVQLRTEDRKDEYRQIVEGIRQPAGAGGPSRVPALIVPIRKAINEWAERSHQIRGHEAIYQALWVARTLLGTNALTKHVAELAALQCGVCLLYTSRCV